MLNNIRSRDDVYIISVSENAITGCSIESQETKYDEVQDVYIGVIEGQEANLYNLAEAIAYDCFSTDSVGLRLLAKQLRCHVKTDAKDYELIIPKFQCIDDYIRCIAEQIKL